MWKAILRSGSVLLRYGLGVGIIIYLYKSKQIDFNALKNIDNQTAFIALILCILQLLLSAWRVKILLASQQIFVSFSRCTIYNAVGIFYSTLLPGGMSGDAPRAYYFWRCKQTSNCTKSALIAALVSDRFIGTLSLLFVGLVAATISAKKIGMTIHGMMLFWIIFICGVCGYLLLCGSHKYNWKIPGKRLLKSLDLRAYPPSVLWYSILFSMLIQISSIFVIYLFAQRLSSGLDLGQVMAVSPIGFLANSLPVSPGGLGVGESSFDFLFSMVGGQHGSNVFLISRVFLFSPAILGGLLALQLLVGWKRGPTTHCETVT